MTNPPIDSSRLESFQPIASSKVSMSKVQMPMNLKLRYRNSFIDVDDEEMAGPKVRASSTPPAFLRNDVDEDVNENGLRFYVESLSKKLQAEGYDAVSPSASTEEGTPKSSMSTDGEAEEWVPSDGRPLSELLPSTGSLGHPEVCRRPCIYYLAGHCANGTECTYCHLPHVDKTPKLDKRQRTIMQGLSRQELLALVLRFCRLKAEQAGMEYEAQEVLSLMEEEAAGDASLSATISERDVRNLHKTLARMNFSNLIGLVTHQSPSRAKQSPESAERIADALERLRVKFLPA